MPRRPSLLAALLLTAAGCTAAPGTGDQEVPPVGEQARALSVPFDDYILSRLDLHTIEYAEDLLTQDCMRGLGLDWEMLPPPAEHDDDPLNRRRYGLIEPEMAERYGYHPPPLTPGQQEREEVWAEREALPAAEEAAAYGEDGEGGCRADARQRLQADVPEMDPDLLNGYIGDAFEASQQDPAVTEAFEEWGSCMADEGFDYAGPLDAPADPAWWEEEEEAASPAEIDTARADVRCKEEADLVGVWSAAEEEIQNEVIAANPADFELFEQARDAELGAAREVIEEARAATG